MAIGEADVSGGGIVPQAAPEHQTGGAASTAHADHAWTGAEPFVSVTAHMSSPCLPSTGEAVRLSSRPLRGRTRGARPRPLRRAGGLIAAVGLAFAVTGGAGIGGPRRAGATAIDEPYVGGIGFSGPTTGDLAAVYWNPAALGLLRGAHFMVAGTALHQTMSVTRAAIDPTTGLPAAGGIAPGSARAGGWTSPITWPAGPGGFAGLAYDVGGDRLTLAVAAFMPYRERATFEVAHGAADAGGAAPGAGMSALATRYHRISADLRNLALVPALSVRFLDDFRLGVAPGFLFSAGRLSFAEPTCPPGTACTAEDPANDAVLDLGSGLGLFSSTFAVTLGAGAYYRRRSWAAGVSFSSRPFGGDVQGAVVIRGDRSVVTLPGGSPVGCAGQATDLTGCVFADIVYRLPYTVAAGFSLFPRPGLEVAAIGRLLVYPDRDTIDIRLTAIDIGATGLAEQIVLNRGYHRALDVRLRVAAWVTERLRVGAGVRAGTAALPAAAVNPGAIDGLKVEPHAMVMFRPVKHLWLAAGYAFTYLLPVSTTTSVFDPTAGARCLEAGEDITAPACIDRRNGRARPSAAGDYQQSAHRLSLSMTVQF